jgi:hypothetical protein
MPLCGNGFHRPAMKEKPAKLLLMFAVGAPRRKRTPSCRFAGTVFIAQR